MDTRPSSPTGTNQSPRHIEPGHISPKISRLSRRKFGGIFGLTVTAVTGILGGLVGYTPRANAAPPHCDFDYEPLQGCQCYPGQPTCACLGICSATESRCQWGPRPAEDYCVVYNFSPGIHPGARAVGSCNGGNSAGYYCGVYC